MTYIVRIQPENLLLFVEPNEAILDAALRQGFDIAYGCHNGVCGTCAARLLEGEIDYPNVEPVGLEEDEINANYILLCSAIPQSDLVIEHAGVTAPWQIPVKTLTYRLGSMQALSSTVMQIVLEPPETHHIRYCAGQYVYLYNSTGEKRPYSIANAPHGGKHIELHVRHTDENEFSNILLNDLTTQQCLQLEGPFGSCIYHSIPDVPVIFVAGGTGFTQSKALIEQFMMSAPNTPMHLFWGAKTSADLYMNELPLQWCETLPAFSYTPTISRSDDDQLWQGQTQSLPELVTQHYPDLSRVKIYASGPATLVAAAYNHFKSFGLRREFIYSDAFEFLQEEV